MLFAQEILSLNSKCIPLIYKLVEGKFKIGFNKRTNLYYYHIDGIAVEEFKNKPTVIGINKRIFVKANV